KDCLEYADEVDELAETRALRPKVRHQGPRRGRGRPVEQRDEFAADGGETVGDFLACALGPPHFGPEVAFLLEKSRAFSFQRRRSVAALLVLGAKVSVFPVRRLDTTAEPIIAVEDIAHETQAALALGHPPTRPVPIGFGRCVHSSFPLERGARGLRSL